MVVANLASTPWMCPVGGHPFDGDGHPIIHPTDGKGHPIVQLVASEGHPVVVPHPDGEGDHASLDILSKTSLDILSLPLGNTL
jgi:hypothetical protein